MTSNDQQQSLTVELFNAKMDTLMAQIQLGNEKLRSELRSEFQSEISGLQSKFQSEISGLRSEMQAGFATLQTLTQVNSAKIEILQHTFYWGFGIMTAVIALITIFAPNFFRSRNLKDKDEKSSEQTLSRSDVQDMISQALDSFKAVGK